MASTRQITSLDQLQTINIAKQVGSMLRGGECIELVGDVGSGKTTFVRGLARGAGSKDHVSSPTFTISKIYKTPNFEIAHFDFYRLHDVGLIKHELEEYLNDTAVVLLIEWSDVIRDVLPKENIKIELKSPSQNSRIITITVPTSSSLSDFLLNDKMLK